MSNIYTTKDANDLRRKFPELAIKFRELLTVPPNATYEEVLHNELRAYRIWSDIFSFIFEQGQIDAAKKIWAKNEKFSLEDIKKALNLGPEQFHDFVEELSC